MLIGELAQRTGVRTRLLRYYEEQGLLHPDRDANGYRSYPDTAPETVRRIRELLAAGLSTADIQALLPCARDEQPGVEPCAMSLGIIDNRFAELDGKIADLERQRALLARQRAATLGSWTLPR